MVTENGNNERKNSRPCHRHHSSRSGKAESVISSVSTDSEIRFTRKKLGDNTKCGCVLIAAFLVILLLAATIFYIGCKYCILSFEKLVLSAKLSFISSNWLIGYGICFLLWLYTNCTLTLVLIIMLIAINKC